MKLFGILLLTISFTQCKSHKFEQTPPFSVKSATYTHVTGGTPGNNTLDLMIEFTTEKDVQFEAVSFQERTIQPVIEQKGGKQYLAARFDTSTPNSKKKYDLELHSDSKKEYGNKPKEEAINLKENEAIIVYKVNGKSHFYKLENIEKKESVRMPSAKPQSNQKHL
ncbi:hypothetical protein [uncultured Tenacibaculum sp.]|uniref:hypothetical protein n=1 Tax=uncultured Tenacibaculum sp. TaxID=174713 RepID=UPI002615F91F|nr:hypothetical protein [uncultured Tenacibaculum sp.]